MTDATVALLALPEDLAEFLEGGISILVGTRDAGLQPATLRAMGAAVDARGGRVTLYVPEATAERTIANLRDNGRIAVTFSRAVDHRSIQVKGTGAAIRRSGEQDRHIQERYLSRLVEGLSLVGFPAEAIRRASYWPSFAVEIDVTELYEQTPGPRAGTRLAC